MGPHIISILADDAGWNDFGFTRGILAPSAELVGPQAMTPNIDALAAGGITLANHYSYRYCSPSRAAFLTGRLPFHVHEANPGLTTAGCTNLNYTMLGAKLAAAGYEAYQVGKWHQGIEHIDCVPVRRGFGGGSFGYLSGAEDYTDQQVPVCDGCVDNAAGGGCVDLWRDLAPAHGENGTYNDYSFANQAVAYIEGHAQRFSSAVAGGGAVVTKPMFLYAAFQGVHGPYEVPQKYRALFPPDVSCAAKGTTPDCCGVTDATGPLGACPTASAEGVCKCPDKSGHVFQPPSLNCPPGGQCTRNFMLAMLAALDDAVGNVTAALKRTGMYDSSIILFTSDNGGAVADGEPQAPNGQAGAMNNYPLRGGKGGYFEGGVRSAAFIHSPALLPGSAGTVDSGLISIADWWATFAIAAGLSADDPGFLGNRTGLPAAWGCRENEVCEFGLDSVSMWGYLTRIRNRTADASASVAQQQQQPQQQQQQQQQQQLLQQQVAAPSPRTELMLGVLGGGALLQSGADDTLYKYVEGNQYPDFWYG